MSRRSSVNFQTGNLSKDLTGLAEDIVVNTEEAYNNVSQNIENCLQEVQRVAGDKDIHVIEHILKMRLTMQPGGVTHLKKWAQEEAMTEMQNERSRIDQSMIELYAMVYPPKRSQWKDSDTETFKSALEVITIPAHLFVLPTNTEELETMSTQLRKVIHKFNATMEFLAEAAFSFYKKVALTIEKGGVYVFKLEEEDLKGQKEEYSKLFSSLLMDIMVSYTICTYIVMWIGLHIRVRVTHHEANEALTELNNFKINSELTKLRAQTRLSNQEPSLRYQMLYKKEADRAFKLIEDAADKINKYRELEENRNTVVGKCVKHCFIPNTSMFMMWARLMPLANEPRLKSIIKMTELLFQKFREPLFSVFTLKINNSQLDNQQERVLEAVTTMDPRQVFARNSQLDLGSIPTNTLQTQDIKPDSPQGVMLRIFITSFEDLKDMMVEQQDVVSKKLPLDLSKLSRLKALLDEISRLATTIDTNLNSLHSNATGRDVEDYLGNRRVWISSRLDAVELISKLEDMKRKAEEEAKSKRIVIEKSLPYQKLIKFSGCREDWFEFYKKFSAMFPVSLPDTYRLNMLVSSLSTQPREIILGASTCIEALHLLKKEYGSRVDEVARILSSLEDLPMPRDQISEYSNICQIKSAKRRLLKLGEGAHLDRLRLMRLASRILLRQNMVKFNEIIVEERQKLRQVYSIQHPGLTDEQMDMLEDEEDQELIIDNEEFSRLWWSFINVRQEVAASVSGYRRNYGQLLDGAFQSKNDGHAKTKEERPGNGKPRPARVNQSLHSFQDRENRGGARPKEVYIAFEGKCSIRSCGGQHWTRNCPIIKNQLPDDICRRIIDSDSCIRCLAPNARCQSKCQGGYLGYDRNTSKRKFRSTDCNQKCMYTVNGKKVPINYLICKCRRDKQKERKPREEDKKQDFNKKRGSDQKNKKDFNRRKAEVNRLQFEEEVSEDSGDDYDDYDDYEDNGRGSHINNFTLLTNEVNTGYSSQMIEHIEIFNPTEEKYQQILVLWDSGTNSTSVDSEFAEGFFIEKEDVKPLTVRTIHGTAKAMTKYIMRTRDAQGKVHEFTSVGLNGMANHYEESTVEVPAQLKKRFSLKKKDLYTKPGRVQIIFGTDCSRLWPQEQNNGREGGVIILRSLLTNKFLIQGAKIQDKEEETMLNRICFNNRICFERKSSPPLEMLSSSSNDVPYEGRENKDGIVSRPAKINIIKMDGMESSMFMSPEDNKFYSLYGAEQESIAPIKSRNCKTCSEDMSKNEDEILQRGLMNEAIYFDEEKRAWHGSYLYNQDRVERMINNVVYSEKTCSRLQKKMAAFEDKTAAQFNEALQTALDMGAIVSVDQKPELQKMKTRFLPMNFAFSGKEGSTPCRPTFDGGAICGYQDVCFNSTALKGPNPCDLQKSLLALRSHIYFATKDMSKAYWNLHIDEQTQALSHLHLMVNEEGKVAFGSPNSTMKVFIIVRATFGQIPASSLLYLTIVKSAEKFCNLPKTIDQVTNYCYADDIGVMSNEEDELLALMEDVNQMLEKSGWKSHSWLTNMTPTDVVSKDEMDAYALDKLFGYRYDRTTDEFILRVRINLSKRRRNKMMGEDVELAAEVRDYVKIYGLTKRLILRISMSCWDISGFLMPIQLMLRLNYRQTLQEEDPGLGWDTQLSGPTIERYITLFSTLLSFNGIRWNRGLLSKHGYIEGTATLAIVYDGSSLAAAATAYLVTERKESDVEKKNTFNHVQICLARGKIAPANGSSTPRMELAAATIGAHLKEWITKNIPLKIDNFVYIGDSTCAIRQINSRAILFSQYEQERIRQCQNLTDTSCYYHVSSADNSSDIATRPFIKREDLESGKWRFGGFLHNKISMWPMKKLPKSQKELLPGVLPKYSNIMNNVMYDRSNVCDNMDGEVACIASAPDCDKTLGIPSTDPNNGQPHNDTSSTSTTTREVKHYNLLNKMKPSVNRAAAMKKLRTTNPAPIPHFFSQREQLMEQLSEEPEQEKWASMLSKHVNLDWTKRVLAYCLKWRHRRLSLAELVIKVNHLLHLQSSLETKIMLSRMRIHDLIIEKNSVPHIMNRKIIGSNLYPEDTIVISKDTALGKAICAFAHSKAHTSHPRSIAAMIRPEYYIPSITLLLQQLEDDCFSCRRYKRVNMRTRSLGIPSSRMGPADCWLHITADSCGPFPVRSLERGDRRRSKCYILIAVCQSSGLADLSILADATASSVTLSLDILQSRCGGIRSLRLDPAGNFIGLSGEKQYADIIDHTDEDQKNGELRDKIRVLQEHAGANKYKLFISPPKSSNFQGMAEQVVHYLKTAFSFKTRTVLHVLEMLALIKRQEFIFNNRPVALQTPDIILSRFDLLSGTRRFTGNHPNIFAERESGLNMSEFKEHLSEIDECVDEFWFRHRAATLQKMLFIEKQRFSGEKVPSVGLIVCLPDKQQAAGCYSIGRIKSIEKSGDGELRTCHVEVTRPKMRSLHPYPLDKISTTKKTFRRTTDKLVFLVDPSIHSNEFLYEDLHQGGLQEVGQGREEQGGEEQGGEEQGGEEQGREELGMDEQGGEDHPGGVQRSERRKKLKVTFGEPIQSMVDIKKKLKRRK